MNTLIEQTARFLSRSNSPFIREKSLTPDEIVDLMDKGEEVANAISKDSKKDPEERETARDVLSWIKDVRKTWNKDNSLHPNVVTKLKIPINPPINLLVPSRDAELIYWVC